MRRALLALVAAHAGPQLAAGEPVCFAPTDACGTTSIGMLLDASKTYTAPEATAMRAAVADINADLNVLPHTQLVLREENISEFARVVETDGLSPEESDLLEEYQLESVVALGLATPAAARARRPPPRHPDQRIRLCVLGT